MAQPGFEARRLGTDDQQVVLELMDDAVAWLNRHGITEQWGTEPFSADPKRIAMVTGWLERDLPILATYDGHPAGALVLGSAPDYVPTPEEPEIYVNLLVSNHRPDSRGVGRWLLAKADEVARERQVPRLRVDCYAGRGSRLPSFYESCGYERCGDFTVGEWQGAILQRRLELEEKA